MRVLRFPFSKTYCAVIKHSQNICFVVYRTKFLIFASCYKTRTGKEKEVKLKEVAVVNTISNWLTFKNQSLIKSAHLCCACLLAHAYVELPLIQNLPLESSGEVAMAFKTPVQ